MLIPNVDPQMLIPNVVGGFSRRSQRGLIAAARSDLMEFDDIPEGVSHEDLIRVLVDPSLHSPEPNSLPLQLPPGFVNVFHCQRNMRQRRILSFAERDRRHTLRAYQMDGRSVPVVADKDPEAGHTRDGGSLRVRLQTQDIRVETAGSFQFCWSRADTNAVMVQFYDFDGHVLFPRSAATLQAPI